MLKHQFPDSLERFDAVLTPGKNQKRIAFFFIFVLSSFLKKSNFFSSFQFSFYTLEKQKRLLAELLYKNQLYVNLPEIDDAMFNVSKEDKKLNKAFYGGCQ